MAVEPTEVPGNAKPCFPEGSGNSIFQSMGRSILGLQGQAFISCNFLGNRECRTAPQLEQGGSPLLSRGSALLYCHCPPSPPPVRIFRLSHRAGKSSAVADAGREPNSEAAHQHRALLRSVIASASTHRRRVVPVPLGAEDKSVPVDNRSEEGYGGN